MSITTVGNHLIHYEVLGRGQPVIFIHGWLGSWRYWWPSMQEMSMHHRSFAFDLWGFGDSSKAKELYSLAQYTAMLDQFMDKLGVTTPVTLIGHSLGAVVGLLYTLQRPDLISKLVTVSLPVHGGSLNERLLTNDPDTILNRVIGRSNSFTEIDSELRKTDPEAMNQIAREISQRNFAEDLISCQRPILMVFGEQDPLIQPPTGDYYHLQKNGYNRFYVGLDNCNHFPMLQETAKFNRLLLDFSLAGDDLTKLEPKEYWYRRTR
jgi:pimeloyl-ACP methyl ester carboxylesterase